jgi:hypothetical protein
MQDTVKDGIQQPECGLIACLRNRKILANKFINGGGTRLSWWEGVNNTTLSIAGTTHQLDGLVID